MRIPGLSMLQSAVRCVTICCTMHYNLLYVVLQTAVRCVTICCTMCYNLLYDVLHSAVRCATICCTLYYKLLYDVLHSAPTPASWGCGPMGATKNQQFFTLKWKKNRSGIKAAAPEKAKENRPRKWRKTCIFHFQASKKITFYFSFFLFFRNPQEITPIFIFVFLFPGFSVFSAWNTWERFSGALRAPVSLFPGWKS